MGGCVGRVVVVGVGGRWGPRGGWGVLEFYRPLCARGLGQGIRGVVHACFGWETVTLWAQKGVPRNVDYHFAPVCNVLIY